MLNRLAPTPSQTLTSLIDKANKEVRYPLHIAASRPVTHLHSAYPTGSPRLLLAWGPMLLLWSVIDAPRRLPVNPSVAVVRRPRQALHRVGPATAGTISGKLFTVDRIAVPPTWIHPVRDFVVR